MQVSATLIAAQQAAREAQARFQQAHAPALKAGFAAALTEVGKMAEAGKMGEIAKAQAFSPLSLKQTAPGPDAAPAAQPDAKSTRLGAFLDITI